jgi:hypothetical protein
MWKQIRVTLMTFVVLLSVFMVVCLCYLCFFPHYWHYSHFDLCDDNDNSFRIPFGFYCKEPNIMIINGRVCKNLPPSFRVIIGGTGILQTSGLGFNYSGDEKIPCFYHKYHYNRIAPYIGFYDGNLLKMFLLRESLTGKSKIMVDGKTYRNKGKNPLILLINDDGSVEEIESFVNTFGVCLEDFLSKPFPLSICVDAQSTDVQPILPDVKSIDLELNPEKKGNR